MAKSLYAEHWDSQAILKARQTNPPKEVVFITRVSTVTLNQWLRKCRECNYFPPRGIH